MGTCFGDVKDVKLVNHQVHGVKLVIYQLAKCVNSFCLCVKTSVHMYKMVRVKGPLVIHSLPHFSPFFTDWPTFKSYNSPLKVISEGLKVEYLPVGS